VCTGLGLLVTFAVLQGGQRTYVASTRLLVSGTTDKTGSSSTADTVSAIATSRSQLSKALSDVGVDRDLSTFAHDVSVQAVGTSGIVELSVADEDRAVATSLANALTANVAQAMRDAHLATYPLPSLIDSAVSSAVKTIPPMRRQDLALGALIGLIVGIGLAALLEALNPTVVGKEAIAAHLGAPVLGVLPLTPREGSRDLPWVRWQLGAQAARAGVATVQLATVGPNIDLLPISAALVTNGSTPQRRPSPGPAREQVSKLKIGILDRTSSLSIYPDESAGLVVVTPRTVKRIELESAKDLQRVTGWPAVGAIVYRTGRVDAALGRSGGDSRGAGSRRMFLPSIKTRAVRAPSSKIRPADEEAKRDGVRG